MFESRTVLGFGLLSKKGMGRHHHKCFLMSWSVGFHSNYNIWGVGRYQMKSKRSTPEPCSLNPENQTLELCDDEVLLSQSMSTILYLCSNEIQTSRDFEHRNVSRACSFFSQGYCKRACLKNYSCKMNNSFTLLVASGEFPKWILPKQCCRNRIVLCAKAFQINVAGSWTVV